MDSRHICENAKVLRAAKSFAGLDRGKANSSINRQIYVRLSDEKQLVVYRVISST